MSVRRPLDGTFKHHALQDVIRGIGHLDGENIYSGIQLLGKNVKKVVRLLYVSMIIPFITYTSFRDP